MLLQEHHFPYHATTPPTSPLNTFYRPAYTPTSSYDDSFLPPTIFTFPTTKSDPPTPPISHKNTTPTPISTASPPSVLTHTPSSYNSHSPPTLSSHSTLPLIVDLFDISSFPPLPTRKSTRTSKPPSHLYDFICSTTHWCNLVQFSSLPICHQSLLASQSQWNEPQSYKQAAQDPLWVKAMDLELQALQTNHTLDLVSLPPGKKTIGRKWVYKIKLRANGSLERYKACFVAKGYTQEYRVDFHETFSPVVRMTTIRCVLAIAASHK